MQLSGETERANRMTDRAARNRLRRAKAAKTREKIADAAESSRRLIQFNFEKRVAIYARWSNLVQMDRHQQSLKDQTEGQQKRALELGWRSDQVDIIMADADYSGTVDIDDRDPEGLPALLKKNQGRSLWRDL